MVLVVWTPALLVREVVVVMWLALTETDADAAAAGEAEQDAAAEEGPRLFMGMVVVAVEAAELPLLLSLLFRRFSRRRRFVPGSLQKENGQGTDTSLSKFRKTSKRDAAVLRYFAFLRVLASLCSSDEKGKVCLQRLTLSRIQD